MWALEYFAQFHFVSYDNNISIGIGYIVLFASALLLPLPSAVLVIVIETIAINYTDLLNLHVVSTILIDILMLFTFESWIAFTKRAPFIMKYMPGVMLSCAVCVFVYFLIDFIISGLSVAALYLGFRAIEIFFCAVISLPILYLISTQNMGVRKYSPRYRLK